MIANSISLSLPWEKGLDGPARLTARIALGLEALMILYCPKVATATFLGLSTSQDIGYRFILDNSGAAGDSSFGVSVHINMVRLVFQMIVVAAVAFGVIRFQQGGGARKVASVESYERSAGAASGSRRLIPSDYKNDIPWGIGATVVFGFVTGLFALMALFVLFLGSRMPLTSLAPASATDMGIFMALGLLLIGVIPGFGVIGGLGIYQGKRLGFIAVAVLSGAGVLLGLGTLKEGVGLFYLLACGALLYYTVRRLTGREGPIPE